MLYTWVQSKKDEEGFTLIELLVVVIIIGILAAIAIPTFLNQRRAGWQSELTSNIRNTALEVEAAATSAGGDYAEAVDETAAIAFLEQVQSGDAPVTIEGSNFTSTTFRICGQHELLDEGAGGAVIYDSDLGGIQQFADGRACAADGTLAAAG